MSIHLSPYEVSLLKRCDESVRAARLMRHIANGPIDTDDIMREPMEFSTEDKLRAAEQRKDELFAEVKDERNLKIKYMRQRDDAFHQLRHAEAEVRRLTNLMDERRSGFPWRTALVVGGLIFAVLWLGR